MQNGDFADTMPSDQWLVRCVANGCLTLVESRHEAENVADYFAEMGCVECGYVGGFEIDEWD